MIKPTFNISKEYKISKNNIQFSVKLCCSEQISITLYEINTISSFYYVANLTLMSMIKLNKIFKIYDSLEEAFNFLEKNFDKNKVDINISGENISLVIKIFSPFGQEEEIVIPLEKKIKDKSLMDETLCKEINELKKKVCFLENENINLKKLIENINLRVNKLENNDEIKSTNTEIQIDSKIITKKDEIQFIENRLKEVFINKMIKYNLLYRATRDGDSASTFHSKCDNKIQVLTLYKTTKGIKFGGYTDIGFDCSSKWKQDLKCFIFSLDKKKIYNAKEDNQVGCYKIIGPTFGLNDVAIYLLDNISILSQKSKTHHTCKNTLSFVGLNDYEINNGEQYFNLQELEVFQGFTILIDKSLNSFCLFLTIKLLK